MKEAYFLQVALKDGIKGIGGSFNIITVLLIETGRRLCNEQGPLQKYEGAKVSDIVICMFYKFSREAKEKYFRCVLSSKALQQITNNGISSKAIFAIYKI